MAATKPTNKRARKAEIEAVVGASGSGKTSYVMAKLKALKPERLLVWDTKGEFAIEGYAKPIASIKQLLDLIIASKGKPFKYAYRPNGDANKFKKDFSIFCLAAFHAKNLTLVAEELSDVTEAHYACEGWRKCTTQGRTEGLTIYGLSQHPASLDKHFFGNCSTVRTGRLNFEAHIKAMANCLSVPKDEISNLMAGQYIQRDMNVGSVTRGKLF